MGCRAGRIIPEAAARSQVAGAVPFRADRKSRYDNALMEAFPLRTDLTRAVIGGFALPLGIEPGDIKPPATGYTVTYEAGTDDEPDTYSFYVAVSHERVAPILHRAFALLPSRVSGIVEISSCDAYRPIDVFIGREEITLRQFLATWNECESVLLEDGSIAAGANSDSPYVEVFMDQWKGVSIIVSLDMRDEVESMLQEFGLEEVPETWPVGPDNPDLERSRMRPVLDASGDAADIDDVLLLLRNDWRLELNVDPDTNVDEAGRDLGRTLWHAVVAVQDAGSAARAEVSVWATAGSLVELDSLIDEVLLAEPGWQPVELYSADRIAYDERPDELSDLPPRRERAEVHRVSIHKEEGA